MEDIEEAFPSVSSLERPLPLPEQEVWRTFYEGQDPTGSVTVDDENIDFGACSRLRMSEYRTVTVTNKTDYKVTSLWHAPDGPDGSPAFTVFPETTDIRPRSQAEFRLQFRPAKGSQQVEFRLEDRIGILQCTLHFLAIHLSPLAGHDT